MTWADLGDIGLHYRIDGPEAGAPLVFGNSLGTDLRIWDAVVARLPQNLRVIRYDMRGHGLSDRPAAPYAMGSLVRDAERLLDHLNVREAVFVGLSVGGMVAQGLAVKRLDQLRAIVLSNTAARIGNAGLWQDRIDAVNTGGIEALADATMERWFSKSFRARPELALWRNMLTSTPVEGYAGTSAAISGSDFISTTSTLKLPCLAIAGSEDGATPPDLVRETADLIAGSQFALMRGAGHIPCVEKPDDYARLLTTFLTDIGHI
ncbi:3-oxoadipate enol-lactonase [Alphaproteobacteria bacterium KMM 3653]|uniref:3-oxoadipate enol-lactonase n=1 Tax=Harenicola maris TaxID=2841044 RepID=A0AAP2G4P6_9RHOB|nr:3-oxoadipate enol-lactonase [Harenicola maris]